MDHSLRNARPEGQHSLHNQLMSGMACDACESRVHSLSTQSVIVPSKIKALLIMHDDTLTERLRIKEAGDLPD